MNKKFDKEKKLGYVFTVPCILLIFEKSLLLSYFLNFIYRVFSK